MLFVIFFSALLIISAAEVLSLPSGALIKRNQQMKLHEEIAAPS